MGLDFDDGDGQTPLDEDEKEGLLIPTITTRGDLDEFEQLGIEGALQWTLNRKFSLDHILTEDFVKELHKKMFAEIWSWAGHLRTSNKNLGVDKREIGVELKKLLDDCRYWIETEAFEEDEIAVRFSHRMVKIHPFANGNGRHSRLIADVLASDGLGRPPFTWGSIHFTSGGIARAAYLKAIREADDDNYNTLIKFARE